MHILELPKIQDEEMKQLILKDESQVMSFLKQSIDLLETKQAQVLNQSDLTSLLELDLDDENVHISQELQEHLYTILSSPNLGKAITNLSEYLLMTQAMKGQIKVSLANSHITCRQLHSGSLVD